MKSTKSLEKDASEGNILIHRAFSDLREAPVTDTNRKIFATTGENLQFITHSNGTIMKAYEICRNFDILYGEEDKKSYHMTLMEDILRLAAAHNNQRTRDAIDALAAGGAMPGEYYTGESKRNKENSILRIEKEENESTGL